MIRLRSKPRQRAEGAAQVRLMTGLEIHLANRLATEFQHVAATCHREYENHGAVDEGVFLAHRHRLERILEPAWTGAAMSFARRVIDASKPKSEEDEVESSVRAWIREMSGTRVKGISKSTSEYVAAVVSANADGDLSRREVADLIASKIGGAAGLARAKMIAQTETHAAAQFGSMEAARSLDIPNLKKVWLATHDDRVRESHLEADGQEVAMDAPFIIQDQDGDDVELDFPGDPSGPADQVVNCRCVMVYE